MSDNKNSNTLKGRNSFDVTIADTVVPFFNRNSTPYPVEAGGPKFEPIPITREKDQMINTARLHAEQEYDRIMELVTVLQRQAQDIKRRLDITDMVHSAKYNFRLAHGQVYWLARDTRRNEIILCGQGPTGWHAGPPSNYEYIVAVRWLGDYTWTEVKDKA
jgi:hypothetical protein